MRMAIDNAVVQRENPRLVTRVMADPLLYKEEVHNGWLNGDIDFATDGLVYHPVRRREGFRQ